MKKPMDLSDPASSWAIEFGKKEKKVSLFLEGSPIAMMRHRMATTDKKGRKLNFPHLYNKQDGLVKSVRNDIYFTMLRTGAPGVRFLGAVRIRFVFVFNVPKSWPGKKKETALSKPYPVTVKPDLDNLEKFYMDVFTGLFYGDDKQVAGLESQKIYGRTAGTSITLEEWA